MTPFFFSSGMGVLTFTRACLKVLIGLKAALTPREVHTLQLLTEASNIW